MCAPMPPKCAVVIHHFIVIVIPNIHFVVPARSHNLHASTHIGNIEVAPNTPVCLYRPQGVLTANTRIANAQLTKFDIAIML